MDEFFKMDIFFVVTTAVVLLGGIFGLVALVYVIRILRSVDNVAKNVSDESDNLRGDFGVLRNKIREEGMKVKHFSDFVESITTRHRTRKKKAETK